MHAYFLKTGMYSYSHTPPEHVCSHTFFGRIYKHTLPINNNKCAYTLVNSMWAYYTGLLLYIGKVLHT
jgi:hypothetical protein